MVLELEKRDNHYYGYCLCDCGNKKFIRTDIIVSGTVKSCGCYRKENSWVTTHRMSYTRFYHIWDNAKYRILKKGNKNWMAYGGRGLTFSKRWMNFENFKEDMLEKYEEHVKKFGEKYTTIDRINNNKGYSKKNCRWTTPKIQSDNRRNTRFIRFEGKKWSASLLAEKFGMQPTTLKSRISNGWSMARISKTPVGKYNH